MDPIKLTSQSDADCGVLVGAQVDKVKDMNFHVRQTLVSISVEMSGHFSFFHIVHYLVEVTLEPLFQTVLCLPYILLLASPAGDAVDKVVAFARHVVFGAVFPSRHGGHYIVLNCLVQFNVIRRYVKTNSVYTTHRLNALAAPPGIRV